MPIREVYTCRCDICQQDLDHPEKRWHQRVNLLLSRLDEQQRRWFVAHESQGIGYGGDRLLSQITGIDEKTIARGRQELENDLVDRPTERTRLPGGGRPLAEKKFNVRTDPQSSGRTRNGGRSHVGTKMGKK